jgi:hypothetical protein
MAKKIAMRRKALRLVLTCLIDDLPSLCGNGRPSDLSGG